MCLATLMTTRAQTPFGQRINITNVIKPLIRPAMTEPDEPKAVFILGHVSNPYSGTYNPAAHRAPPPLDLIIAGRGRRHFYGDMDGPGQIGAPT